MPPMSYCGARSPEPEVGLLWGQGKGAKVSIRHSHCRVGPKYLT
jgi:hypothetical protein